VVYKHTQSVDKHLISVVASRRLSSTTKTREGRTMHQIILPERKRERERERERDRQTDRQTDRQKRVERNLDSRTALGQLNNN